MLSRILTNLTVPKRHKTLLEQRGSTNKILYQFEKELCET